jgi:hypothetical protein
MKEMEIECSSGISERHYFGGGGGGALLCSVVRCVLRQGPRKYYFVINVKLHDLVKLFGGLHRKGMI